MKDVDKPWNVKRPANTRSNTASTPHVASKGTSLIGHQADLFGSAPAKDLPEAEARLDAIDESDSVPTRVGLEVAIVLPFIVRIALVDVGRACDFEFSTGHMSQVNGSREAQVLCIACHQAGPQPKLEANRQDKAGVQPRMGLNWASSHQQKPLCCSCEMPTSSRSMETMTDGLAFTAKPMLTAGELPSPNVPLVKLAVPVCNKRLNSLAESGATPTSRASFPPARFSAINPRTRPWPEPLSTRAGPTCGQAWVVNVPDAEHQRAAR